MHVLTCWLDYVIDLGSMLQGRYGDSERYKRSPRYARRLKKQDLRPIKARFPMLWLFGENTVVYMLLADRAAARRLNYERITGVRALSRLPITDKAGLLAIWTLSGHKRGTALALNPGIPFLKPIRVVLNRIRQQVGLELDDDIQPDETVVPRRAYRKFDKELIFGSKVRTRTLATLQALGGTLPLHQLRTSVPDEKFGSVGKTIEHFTKVGILRNDNGIVSFVGSPFVTDVRAVLEGYLKESPGFIKAAKAKRLATLPPNAKQRGRCGLLGKGSTERLLIHLAVHGPTRMQRLKEAIQSDLHASDILDHLESDGIVVIQGGRWQRTVSLDAAHPLYPELKALLLKMAGLKPPAGRKRDLRSSRMDFGIVHLFTTKVKRDVLIMLAICENGEIDPKSICRACPERCYATILQRLHDYEKRGIVVKRLRGPMTIYRLNQEYEYHRELRALLRAAARFQRRFLTRAALEVEEYPDNRRAMYLNDLKAKAKARKVRARTRKSRSG